MSDSALASAGVPAPTCLRLAQHVSVLYLELAVNCHFDFVLRWLS